MKRLPHLLALSLGAVLALAQARADIITGAVSPAGAKVVITDAAGREVAKLGAGPYQLQLPAGKYTAHCQAPATRDQAFLSLNDPVTVNIHCG